MRARRAETPARRENGRCCERTGPRRGLGAVGNSCIVAYGARSPARSAAEGHARTWQFKQLQFKQFGSYKTKRKPDGTRKRTRRMQIPIERYALDNGLRVVLSQDHTLPVV